MFNILLDEYPTEWNGYKVNTDFRVGIQIFQASEDKELNDYEKMQVYVMLLFKDKHPNDLQTCAECVDWFLNSWCHDKNPKSSGMAVMNFDVDQGRVYSAFLSQYNIDLNYEKMHFWKFMYLLTNLEECAFTRVIDIRTKKIDAKASKEEKEYYKKAKKIYSLDIEVEKSEEDKLAEEEAVNEFLKALNRSK